MPAMLKEEIKDTFIKRAEELGLGGEEFLNKIADERNVTTVDELLAWMEQQNHPALVMDPIF